MTLGDKIRKYRLLNNKKQAELGEEVGFKKGTADVRINQYETNKMAPKVDIRAKIACALNVDLPAISDICINSFEDIMYILFELEENMGMEIEKRDDKTYLSFDDDNKEIRTFITYINMWKIQKEINMLNFEALSDDERKRRYQLWKARFASNIHEYLSLKEKEIEAYYLPLAKKAYLSVNKNPKISLLLRSLFDAGLTISTTGENSFSETVGPGFTFIVGELLSPPSEDAEILFAQFIAELNCFAELGAEYKTEMQMIDKEVTITYYIPEAVFKLR